MEIKLNTPQKIKTSKNINTNMSTPTPSVTKKTIESNSGAAKKLDRIESTTKGNKVGLYIHTGVGSVVVNGVRYTRDKASEKNPLYVDEKTKAKLEKTGQFKTVITQ